MTVPDSSQQRNRGRSVDPSSLVTSTATGNWTWRRPTWRARRSLCCSAMATGHFSLIGKQASNFAPYRFTRAAEASILLRLSANCNFHARAPASSGEGENFHSRAASSATREKYLLPPPDAILAEVTLPAASTSTLTPILIVPRIVRRALGEISGITRCTMPLSPLEVGLPPPPAPCDSGCVDEGVVWVAEDSAGDPLILPVVFARVIRNTMTTTTTASKST